MQTDWLVQQITQFARLLAVILGLKKRAEYRAAQETIEEALNTLLDLNLDKLCTLAPAELFRRLTIAETALVGREKVLFAAALLDQAGDIHAAQELVEMSVACYVQALHLLLELLNTDDLARLPNYAPSVEDVLGKIDPETLPLETRYATLLYFEKVGAYAQAENVLFDILDAVTGNYEATADLIAAGEMFYTRLQQQSDAALIAGDLKRDEIAASMADLHTYRSREEG